MKGKKEEEQKKATEEVKVTKIPKENDYIVL